MFQNVQDVMMGMLNDEVSNTAMKDGHDFHEVTNEHVTKDDIDVTKGGEAVSNTAMKDSHEAHDVTNEHVTKDDDITEDGEAATDGIKAADESVESGSASQGTLADGFCKHLSGGAGGVKSTPARQWICKDRKVLQ